MRNSCQLNAYSFCSNSLCRTGATLLAHLKEKSEAGSFSTNMSGRRFEWSRRLDAGPTGWTLLSQAVVCRSTALGSGWFLPRFDLVDQVGQVYLECRFDKWCAEDPTVAVYKAEELDHAFWVSYPAGQIYVREVPPPLVVTCNLHRIDDEGAEAVFTTIGGCVILRIARVKMKLTTMERLAETVAVAVAAQDHVQSRNREVCAVLENQPHMHSTVTVPEFYWEKLKAYHARCK